MLVNLIGYFIIPLYTILFVYKSDWLTTNFSVISQLPHRYLGFIVWGCLIGIYFYYMVRKILEKIANHQRENSLLKTSMTFLIFTLNIPYRPDQVPFRSILHVLFACATALLFILCLYIIILKLYYNQKNLYRSYAIALVFITAICFLLFLSAGIVSSALEIFFTVSCSILLCRLYRTANSQNEEHVLESNITILH